MSTTRRPPTPRPPADLQARGRGLWTAVMREYELSPEETPLLIEAARTLDLAERLAAEIASAPLVVDGRPNRLLAEVRAQRDLAGRLLSRLNLPSSDEASNWAAQLGQRGGRAPTRRR